MSYPIRTAREGNCTIKFLTKYNRTVFVQCRNYNEGGGFSVVGVDGDLFEFVREKAAENPKACLKFMQTLAKLQGS